MQQLKQERIAKIAAQLEVQQSQLLQKRKEELFHIFKACNALTIDDRLLIGFLKFVKDASNKNHPILHEFKSLGGKTKMPRANQNQKTSKLIKLITKKLWYTRMQLPKAINFDRKADARNKIMLGGLFVKAGLDYLHPDNAHNSLRNVT